MARKTPNFKNYPSITEAKFRGMIVSHLRRGSRYWRPAMLAKKDAEVGRKKNKKTGKLAMHYKCANCGKLFVAKDIAIDHIIPVVDPVAGFINWDVFIDRLYAPKENYQVLCKECHSIKTKKEKDERRLHH